MDLPNIDETFLMEFPLTPQLQEEYGKDSMIIEAIYRGTLSDQEVAIKKENGSLKEMYNILDNSGHHIVECFGELWINDLINIGPEEVSFKPII